MEDSTAVALGITAAIATVQESLPWPTDPRYYRAMRAGLALGAPFILNRGRPLQRAVVTGLGIWGAAELLQLGYSALIMSADALFLNIQVTRARFKR